MVFRDGNPEDYISMTTGYDYQSEYTEYKDQVIKFFEDIQPNKRERDYMLTYLSLALVGLNKLEQFHVFTGSKGRNGKSKLIELLDYTFGDYFSSISSKLLTKERPMANAPDPGLLHLRKKRLVCASEAEQKDKLNTGFIKFLTGNDKTLLRNCHSNNIVTFKSNFITLFVCNNIPDVDEMDNAFSKRLKVISFDTEFVEKPLKSNEKKIDINLSSKLPLWRQDFMLLLIEYYRNYLINGLQLTDIINSWTNMYKEDTDMYLQYLNERTQESDRHIFMVELYIDFKDWFKNNYPCTRTPNNREFNAGIRKYKNIEKYVRVDNKNSTGIKNLNLKTL
jgi:phage/plasmid-associated DNA primase